MTLETSTLEGRGRIMWRMRLISALRTALACAIVGGTTLYGPEFFVKDIKFAAFSYLTVVLIVPDATLGATLRGCWHAFCATVQVVPLAVLVRWTIPQAGGVPVGVAVLVASAASFLVALPECTHLTTKRIAFGQIVLVCTDAVLIGRATGDGVMHPVYVAASTGLGALASVLALLLPYPDLASHKIRKLYQVYCECTYQRINLYMRAKDSHMIKMELLSQAKPLAEIGPKLLQSITAFQEGMQWERPWCRYSKPDRACHLQTMELQMRGMAYSLASSSSSPAFPLQPTNQDQHSNVLRVVSSKIEQLTCHPQSQPTQERETHKPSRSQSTLHPSPAPAWLHFYSSCADALTCDYIHSTRDLENMKMEPAFFTTLRGRLEFAFKCSISLSLAILFGLIFDKDSGCWAGLTVAISLVEGRQAVFTVANARAQGTAVGSIYGVISCFLFHREELRLLLALLPWIVFTSGFLRHSRMYGQMGGVTAAIGALLILGRKDYGDPSGFAIARLAEVSIGLTVFVAVEILLQPVRAATLARSHLSRTLYSLEDSIKEETGIFSELDKKQVLQKITEIREKQRNFDCLVCELGKFVEEAELEPDFWYLPFRASCYRRVLVSLTNISEMMCFINNNFEMLSKSSEISSTISEWHEQVSNELGICKETLRSSHLYLETDNSTEARADSQHPTDKNFRDLEAGDLPNISEYTERTDNEEDGDKLSERAIAFCVSSLRKELGDFKICIAELTQCAEHSTK